VFPGDIKKGCLKGTFIGYCTSSSPLPYILYIEIIKGGEFKMNVKKAKKLLMNAQNRLKEATELKHTVMVEITVSQKRLEEVRDEIAKEIEESKERLEKLSKRVADIEEELVRENDTLKAVDKQIDEAMEDINKALNLV
jgi:polyhydroxyalkanoate synthesis regulator phasin